MFMKYISSIFCLYYRRVSILHDRMRALTKAHLNDGSMTRAGLGNTSVGMASPDVSIVDSNLADGFSFETMLMIGSEHLLLLHIRGEETKVVRFNTIRCTANSKRIDSCSAIASTKISIRCHRSRQCPIVWRACAASNKSRRHRDSPSTRCPKEISVGRMSDRKKLLQKSSTLRSDLRINRIDWLVTISEITALTEES